ncbi:MAG: hemerythrin domain-containing protein [Bacteroidales bacterium]|nr:hemerythrin domain-containing protein [Bacteroidales bacterium]
MYLTHKTHIKKDMKLSVLINENPFLLLFLEHLEVDFVVKDKTLEQICSEYKLDISTVLLIANLYNGFYPSVSDLKKITDISLIIKFLGNSHKYYKNDKYPEISNYISDLKKIKPSHDIDLISSFFSEYFNEVLEHLDYEDEIAFPYFCRLNEDTRKGQKEKFSVHEYSEHHTDIETKLTDLKNLLLKHISIKNELPLRRRLLISLFELEYDLIIHSMIEEKILLPLVERFEGQEV